MVLSFKKMKSILRAGLVLLVLLSLGEARSHADETAPVVVGYFPSWTCPLPIGKINFGQFTHLIHAFATIKNGAIHTEGNLPSRELTSAGHAAGIKVLLGLGGEDSGAELSAMARNPATEAACVQGLAKLVADNGYDGIDVDWEFPTSADTANAVAFVSQLRQALRQSNPDALVTMPLPWTNYDGQSFDGPKLANLIDLAFIMTYDAHGPWKVDSHNYCHAGFDAPLNETATDSVDGTVYSFPKAVDYWRGKGFKDSQLVVGIHSSGHGFLVDKWGETPLQPSTHGDIEYRRIQGLLDAGWQRQWDDQAGVPWLRSPPALPPELITYDDPQSVALKGKWAHNTGLRGIFFWEISEDYVGGHNVLVEAARKGFGLSEP